jgi:hypothetical protein
VVHLVAVWGKTYEVTTLQRSKGIWSASGEYLGKIVTVLDRSELSALRRWADVARHKGG